MTLANFNTNFNWQLRALKQAADCCGIVPYVPPVPSCYCYTITPDTGTETCHVVYTDCAGVSQVVETNTVDPIYICAKEGSVRVVCPTGSTVVTTGGTVICSVDANCVPFVGDCYWYGKLHDPNCFGFGAPFGGDWILNGEPLTSGTWPNLMVNPPYGTVGNAMNYTDPLSGCGSFNYSDYYFWTVVPSTVLSLPPLTGTDPNSISPVTVPMFGPICIPKCYEGTFRVGTGSTYLIGFLTAEINAPEYSMFVDLTNFFASGNLTYEIGRYYPSPPLNVTVTIVGPDEYTIRIDGLYSLGNVVYVYMDDFITVGELFEIPC